MRLKRNRFLAAAEM